MLGAIFEYTAEVLEVLEADCLRLKIDLGLHHTQELVGLLNGIRSPHIGENGGDKALAVSRAWVWNRDGRVAVHTHRDRRSEWGGYRVDVVDFAGNSLAVALLNCGLAVRLA